MEVKEKTANPERNRKLRNTLFAGSMIAACVLLYAVFGGEKADVENGAEYQQTETQPALSGAYGFMERSGLEGFEFMGRTRNDIVFARARGAYVQTLILSVSEGEVVSFVLRLPIEKNANETKPKESASGTENDKEGGGSEDASTTSLILEDLEKLRAGELLIPDEEEAEPEDANSSGPSDMQLITGLINALAAEATLNFADMEVIRLCIEEAESTGKKRTKRVERFDLTAYVDNDQLLILMDSDK